MGPRRRAAWVSPCFLMAFLLGCASALATSAQESTSGAGDEFSPIRVGDPEDLAYRVPFFAGARQDPSIPTPDQLLGQVVGAHPSHPAAILACFRRWAEVSPRIEVETYARSHEGRELIRAVISSPENLERLPEILAGLGQLADPRGLSDAEARRLIEASPAVAWLGYSIHGDELSGSDAALAVGYHLVAGTGPDVTSLLDRVVVVLDPCLNPDGRERILTQVEQGAGAVTSLDHQSMQRGRWPWGRGNHYLFDLNRDWIAGTQPETRGRWREALRFLPQLFVDAHEMGSLDTYLFYPQARPFNPHLPASLDRWQTVFGNEQAAAFDRHGWAYYTREWADAWAPFYSDSWGSLNSAVGILYEQAGIGGAPIVRASGKIMTYRETVHHQAVSSMANLNTLKDQRQDILRDYLASRRSNVSEDTPGNDRMYVLVAGRNREREDALLSLLLDQGVEVFQATSGFQASGVENTLGEFEGSLDLPEGAYLIPARQPQAPLVKVYLAFDIRIDRETLIEERSELERKNESKLYDNTAWSLSHAFGLEAYWCDAAEVPARRVTAVPARMARVVPPPGEDTRAVAWAVDGGDDASVRFAARAMELKLAVHVADKEFKTAGRLFPRGSLVVRRSENEDGVAEKVRRAAEQARVEVIATASGRSSDKGPDLGGGHFHLLERPRVALLGNAPHAPDTYGHLWHLLDRRVSVPVSHLDVQSLGSHDLRRFNVIVIPPARGGLGSLLGAHKEALASWVQAGGTLIACGSSAAALTSKDLALSSVVQRRNALEDLEEYEFAARREREALEVTIDESELWDEPGEHRAEESSDEKLDEDPDEDPDEDSDENPDKDQERTGDPDAERQDAWMRRFAPRGVFLRGLVNQDSWITAGAPAVMPVFVTGSSVFLSRSPVVAAVRIAGKHEHLRLSGLLWPEARERVAGSAVLTVERKGRGQVILFAAVPGYRGTVRSTGRMFANAVIYGPGVGARPPLGW